MPLISKVGRRKFRVKLVLLTIGAFLWIGVILRMIPLWWMFITSIKPAEEVYLIPPTLFPHRPTFAAYKIIITLSGYISSTGAYSAHPGWMTYPMYVYLKNSLIITFGTMILQIPITALAAYAISKLESPRWSRILFLFFIGTMMIPGQIALIPTYLLIQHFPFPTRSIPYIPFTKIKWPAFNLFNTYFAVIIPASFSAFYFLLFKGFFDTVPDSILNAARVDGASELSILRRIVMPISKPVFAAVSYFSFSAAWNSYMWPLMVLQREKLYPMSVQLARISRLLSGQTMDVRGRGGLTEDLTKMIELGWSWNGLMAMSIVESIPVFVMFIVFREYLMTGIKLRGFK